MPQLHHVEAFIAGLRGVADDTDLTQYDLRMLQRDRIVIDDQHAHFMGIKLAVIHASGPPGGFAHGNRYGKGGAGAFFTFHLDMAVHKLHDVLCDRHSESGAAVSVGGRRILLTECVK